MKAQLANTALGLWLMAAPAVLDYGDPAASSDRTVGPLIVTFAVVAIWEATRSVGRANAPLGAWLLGAPIVLGYPLAALLNSVSVGAAVLALSLLTKRAPPRFGGGWSVLWRGGEATPDRGR